MLSTATKGNLSSYTFIQMVANLDLGQLTDKIQQIQFILKILVVSPLSHVTLGICPYQKPPLCFQKMFYCLKPGIRREELPDEHLSDSLRLRKQVPHFTVHLLIDDERVAGAPVAHLHGLAGCHHVFPHALRRSWGSERLKFIVSASRVR